MNILNTVTKVLFCSLLLISTASLAERRHSDHRGYSDHQANATHQQSQNHQRHNAAIYSRRPHAYAHNQQWRARKHWNKHHNKHQYRGHFNRHHSKYSYRPRHQAYNTYRPRHSSYYYGARRLNKALRHYNHHNHGFRVHLSF